MPLDSYEILRPLGVGGMARVVLARTWDGETERLVAIKQLHDFLADDPASIAMLIEEARLASSIRHPNVVRVLELIDAQDEGGPISLVMECVEGMSLGRLLQALAISKRRLPIDVAVAIARDLLEGLHAAHEACGDDGAPLDIVHRDVSPQNILVGSDGHARLTDFGIAKAAWRMYSTEHGSVKGKLGYMSPEQLDGRADRRADIFAAGAVLWEMLTGKRLRPADGTGAQVLIQILHGVFPEPSVHARDAALLDDVVMCALEHDPDGRFETALEMATALIERVTPASATRVAELVAELMRVRVRRAPARAPVREEGTRLFDAKKTVLLGIVTTTLASIAGCDPPAKQSVALVDEDTPTLLDARFHAEPIEPTLLSAQPRRRSA